MDYVCVLHCVPSNFKPTVRKLEKVSLKISGEIGHLSLTELVLTLKNIQIQCFCNVLQIILQFFICLY